MRKYETLLLLSPELAAETRQQLLTNLTGIIPREQGTVLAVDDWGMRDLAYPVRKQMRGNYVRLEYAAMGNAVAELERNIRIADGIFKFVTVKLADVYQPQTQVEPQAEAPAPQVEPQAEAPAPQPEPQAEAPASQPEPQA
jgi:small subunit ribosomal protein S6